MSPYGEAYILHFAKITGLIIGDKDPKLIQKGILFMSTMDRFIAALELTMELSKDIDGVNSVTWNLTYSGRTNAVNVLARKVNAMMEKNGMTLTKDEVA